MDRMAPTIEALDAAFKAHYETKSTEDHNEDAAWSRVVQTPPSRSALSRNHPLGRPLRALAIVIGGDSRGMAAHKFLPA
jgi:hypothetical protein